MKPSETANGTRLEQHRPPRCTPPFEGATPIFFALLTLALSLPATAQERAVETCPVGTPTTTTGLPDSDADGIANAIDNCLLVPNTDQRDSNGDAFGNACDADLDNNGIVNPVDLGILKSVFFQSEPGLDADLDGDGIVSVDDLAIMRSSFYRAPGPIGDCIADASTCAGPQNFEFDDIGEVGRGSLVVFRTADPATIHHARRLLDGSSICNPNVSGDTFSGTRAWNPAWAFHIDGPILFHGSSVEPLESCDQSAQFIQDNLGIWCGEDGQAQCQFWCPWRSKLTRELAAAGDP